MAKVHNIKLLDIYFDDVCSGIKKAELRFNDRDYQVGDILNMSEITKVDGAARSTGRTVSVTVVHITDCGFMIPNVVMMSIKLNKQKQTPMRKAMIDIANEMGAMLDGGELTASSINGDSQLMSDRISSGCALGRLACIQSTLSPESNAKGGPAAFSSMFNYRKSGYYLDPDSWNPGLTTYGNLSKAAAIFLNAMVEIIEMNR